MGVGCIMVGWSLPVDYWCDSWTLARLAGVGLLQIIGATLILQGYLNDTWVGLLDYYLCDGWRVTSSQHW